MIRFIFILFFFVCFVVISNAQVAYFNKKFDLKGGADESSAIVTTDSGYVVCANGYHAVNGFLGIGLFFLDKNGDSLYTKWIGKDYFHYFDGWSGSFRKYSKGGFYLGGSIGDTSGAAYGLLYLFDENGDTLWTKKYGNGTDFYAFYHARETPDKGFILAGARDIGSNTQGLLIKTDSLGNVEWERNYGGGGTEYGTMVLPTINGAFLLGGLSETMTCSNGGTDQWLVGTNSSGIQQWQKCYGTIDDDGNALPGYEFSNGDFVFVGQLAYNSIKWYPYLFRTNNIGDTIWSKKVGPVGLIGFLRNMITTPNEDIIAVGKWAWSNGEQGLLVRVSKNGDSLWYRKYDFDPSAFDSDHIWDIDTAHNGGYIMCGTTASSSWQDVWIIKVDEHGCLFDPNCWYSAHEDDKWSVGISDLDKEKYFSVFPNPNNGSFFIENKIGIKTDLEIKIYNTIGELLYSTSFNATREDIELTEFSNGIYFVTVSNDGGILWKTKIVKE